MDEFPIQEYRLVPADQVGQNIDEDEIDLIELAKTIWDNRKTIYKFVGVGFILGILVAILSPKEYVSSATLMPEYSTESQSGASSLLKQYGGLLGIGGGGSYSSNSNAIRVDLYPKIVESLSFQDQLARQEFYFPDYDTTASIYEYYMEIQTPSVIGFTKKYTIALPSTIIGVFTTKEESQNNTPYSQDNIVELSKNEMQVIRRLRKQITANLDIESGIITVSAKMSNPRLAASVAKYTIEELTNYLTEYRTEKVSRDLRFIEEQLGKSEERFNEAQLVLAEFQDSNQGNLTARARTDEQKLNSEYDVAFNLYNSLTQQFEEAKLKVQEETPVFKVLQPIQVPVSDETSGIVVLISFLFFSGVASIAWIFISKFLDRF